jgi:murein L,D-transpeptidase YafK
MKSFKSRWWLVLVLLIGATTAAASVLEKGSGSFPDALISVDSEKPVEYALIVEKSTQNLYVYSFGRTNRVILRVPFSTGEVDGPKTRAGDKKTPEGIYFFTRNTRNGIWLGIRQPGIPMDYPNFVDQVSERDGNSIWMHGTDKPLRPRDSNGCIALENRDIDKLAGYITLNRTPIIVVEKLMQVPLQRSQELKKGVEELLMQWEAALAKGTYHQYLMFYDEVYLPDISWWSSWQKIKIPRDLQPVLFPSD